MGLGVGDPYGVEVEVNYVNGLHGVVEGSCHVCGEVFHCVCHGVSHAWVVQHVCEDLVHDLHHVCEDLVHDLHGVVEKVCDEGDLHDVVVEVRCEDNLHGVVGGMVEGSNFDRDGDGAEGEEAHGGELEVHDRGAVCQV